jgi:hypothetical protein
VIHSAQVLLERAEQVEGLIRQRIALDVFHARFRFAFGPRAIGRAPQIPSTKGQSLQQLRRWNSADTI